MGSPILKPVALLGAVVPKRLCYIQWHCQDCFGGTLKTGNGAFQVCAGYLLARLKRFHVLLFSLFRGQNMVKHSSASLIPLRTSIVSCYHKSASDDMRNNVAHGWGRKSWERKQEFPDIILALQNLHVHFTITSSSTTIF